VKLPTIVPTLPIRIAVFASGTGSNARNLVAHFKNRPGAKVTLIASNRADAPVLTMARQEGIATLLISRHALYASDELRISLLDAGIDFIVLAGFLWLIPPALVASFHRRIVNIHPALLPRFGGKGMYGHHVHEAVLQSGERYTGITIHYVDEKYDEGDIIFQSQCMISPTDDVTAIARKVQALEHKHFPMVVEQLITSLNGHAPY